MAVGSGELLWGYKYNLSLCLHLGDTLDLLWFHHSMLRSRCCRMAAGQALATRKPGLLAFSKA